MVSESDGDEGDDDNGRGKDIEVKSEESDSLTPLEDSEMRMTLVGGASSRELVPPGLCEGRGMVGLGDGKRKPAELVSVKDELAMLRSPNLVELV